MEGSSAQNTVCDVGVVTFGVAALGVGLPVSNVILGGSSVLNSVLCRRHDDIRCVARGRFSSDISNGIPSLICAKRVVMLASRRQTSQLSPSVFHYRFEWYSLAYVS